MDMPILPRQPQALQTGYSSRLRLGQTSLFLHTQPIVRVNKRASANVIVNYAEIDEDYDDDEEDSTYGGSGSVDRVLAPERKVAETKHMAYKTRHAVYSEQQLQAVSDKPEVLVPLRLNLELDNYRITDFFMWNINEDIITPEVFASITCADLDLPAHYINQIAVSIKNQLNEYGTMATIQLPTDSEIHVIVHISVNIDKQLYEDRFEWDLTGDLTPEQFAKVVVADLGLAGEFYPAISHSLHETLIRLKKEAIEGHLPQEIDNMAAFSGEAGWRVDPEALGDEWAPTVETLSQEEIEKREIERERNIRRLKRESARMGDQITDIGGLFGRKRRRRFEGDSPSRGGSPAYGW